MDKVTTFVLDEVHQRSRALDDLVVTLRHRVHSNVHSTQRLVMMSAIGDRELWRRYFLQGVAHQR